MNFKCGCFLLWINLLNLNFGQCLLEVAMLRGRAAFQTDLSKARQMDQHEPYEAEGQMQTPASGRE